jgi:hypothetical protein
MTEATCNRGGEAIELNCASRKLPVATDGLGSPTDSGFSVDRKGADGDLLRGHEGTSVARNARASSLLMLAGIGTS